MDDTLTLDKLRGLTRLMQTYAPSRLDVYSSIHALKDSDVRLFPVSKNRSARVHKKLLKRFGGEFRKVPTIWKTPQGFVAHPALYDELKRTLAANAPH